MSGRSTEPTPYATICQGEPGLYSGCGKQYMTEQEYKRQMSRPDSTWRCPGCGMEAAWDDDNYEAWMDTQGGGNGE